MRLVLTLLLLALLAGPAAAQEAADLPRASASVLGGLVLPLGNARDAMGTGWNVGAAGNVRLAGGLGLRIDYLYSRFASESHTWDVALGPMLPAFIRVDVRAKSQMHAGSADLTWTRQMRRGGRAYVMGGPTAFYRRAQMFGDGPPQGPTGVCEPRWLQCAAQPVPFMQAIGIRKSSDLGLNVGAGVAFRTGLTALVTIEARYYRVIGPSFRDTQRRSASGSSSFLPLSVGLAF